MNSVYPDRVPGNSDWDWWRNRWARFHGDLLDDGTVIITSDFHNRSKAEVVAIATELGTNPSSGYTDVADRFDHVLRSDGSDTFASGTLTMASGTILEMEPTSLLSGTITIPEGASLSVSGTFTTVDPYVDVRAYGATGDGTTNDAAAITAAIAACSTGDTLYFPPGTWRIESAISIPKGISIRMEGGACIKYYGSANITALTIGTATQYSGNISITGLRVSRDTQSDFSSEDCIGVKFLSLYNSQIQIAKVEKFTIGVQLISDTQGLAYNTIDLGQITNNKIALDFNTTNGGWVNENLFIGGRLTCGAVNTTIDRYGVRMKSGDSYYNDNNIFLKPCFEFGGRTGGAEGYPFYVEYGRNNRVYSARSEGCSTEFAMLYNASAQNTFEIAYGPVVATLGGDTTQPDNVLLSGSKWTKVSELTATVFDSGAMHKSAGYYDGTKVHIPGCTFISGSPSFGISRSAVTINDNYLNVTGVRGIGIYVDTQIQKEFVLLRDTEDNYEGRAGVVCFDADGAVLSGTSPYYARGGQIGLYYAADWTVYLQSSDNDAAVFIKVHADVKSAFFFIKKGTAALRIRRFVIMTPREYIPYSVPATWIGYEEIVKGAHLATQSPTIGKYKVGRRVYDVVPTEGSESGWECVTRTDTQFRVAGAGTDTILEVGATASMTAGDIIGIDLDDGTTDWTTIASITDADTLVISAGLSSAAAIDKDIYTYRFAPFGHLHLEGSDTWDPGSIANGAEEAKEVTVMGAALGDFAIASFSLDVTDLVLDAQATGANTVTCILANNTGGAIDLGSGTIKVRVLK